MAQQLTHTEQFNEVTSWTLQTSATIITDSFAAPSGVTGYGSNADTLEDNNASGVALVHQAKSKLTSDTADYLYSVYVRKDTNTTRFPYFALEFRNVVTIAVGVRLNTQTGATGTGSDPLPPAYGVVDHDTNWWRMWMRYADPNANTSVRVDIFPAISDTLSGGDGGFNTGSVVCWGANLQQASTLATYESHPAAPSFTVFNMQIG